MDATIVFADSEAAHCRLKPRSSEVVERIAEVSVRVSGLPDLRIGDEIEMSVFGKKVEEEFGLPQIKRRVQSRDGLRLYCECGFLFLDYLACRKGVKLIRKQRRGFRELLYFELPPQKW